MSSSVISVVSISAQEYDGKKAVDEQNMRYAMDFEAEETLDRCARKLREWERRHRLMVSFYQRANRRSIEIVESYKVAMSWTDRHNDVSRMRLAAG